MLRMNYRCQVCGYYSSMLSSAQVHANETRHALDISGEMTPEEGTLKISDALSPSLAAKVREDTIMRLAKQRGVLVNPKVKK